MTKYKNKYRIESARKPGWDYRNPGAYFITICTANRQHFFGDVKNRRMVLSPAGAMVQGYWFEIPKHFDHVQLGEFVVMPNHIHGILILGEREDGGGVDDIGRGMADVGGGVETRQCGGGMETRQCHVSTGDFYRNITPKSGSVSTIIGSFKSICTKQIRKTFLDLNFKWQERFHDHIIRNELSFQRISNYIIGNPAKWEEDKFFK
jgi:REP element-mobilizing transposase RayT